MTRTMVDIPIPSKWTDFWNKWDLRGFIILSLSLQAILIFVAPLRNRTRSKWLTGLLWSAYLLADWVATFAVALISNSQPGGYCGKKVRILVENEDLLAFWAPFLLVHLGGPDTITAFALGDNELWLRHFFGLVSQCLASVYVFVQSVPQNRLWIPTMLMFVTGIIKYFERTRSLYLASANIFKDSLLNPADPGTNYARLMDEYESRKEANLPTRFHLVPEPAALAVKLANKSRKGALTELEVVQYGYHFFNKFKGLVVDLYFSRREQNQCRDFFLNRTAEDAFKVVEVELNFIYDVLFTKLPVVFADMKLWKYKVKVGAISRFFSLATVCSAIVLFIFKNKSNFTAADVTITYGLLFGALVLDMTALIMLLFSDWTIVSIRESPDDIQLEKSSEDFYTKFQDGLLNCISKGKTSKRRWSESISSYNLIGSCLHPHWTRDICEKFLPFGSDFLAGILYVENKEFTPQLRKFIFEELKFKTEFVDNLETLKEISSARGDWVLRAEVGWYSLLKYIVDVDYDQSLILWHIATELCYSKERCDEYTLKARSINIDYDHREISKLLSDYMLYLLILQPSLMSAVAGIGQTRFQDTCAEAIRFFQERNVELSALEHFTKGIWNKNFDLLQAKACIEILRVSTEMVPATIKGRLSKSLLFDVRLHFGKRVDGHRGEKPKFE